MIGRVFDTKKHSNVKKKAEYRRIHKNTKSLEKYKAEKERRKKILELQNQNLTIKQIAAQLEISERTVNRDLAKTMIYVKKQLTQMSRKEDQETISRFLSMTVTQQLKFIENTGNFAKDSAKWANAKPYK